MAKIYPCKHCGDENTVSDPNDWCRYCIEADQDFDDEDDEYWDDGYDEDYEEDED